MKTKRITELDLTEKAVAALKKAVEGVIEEHRRLGMPLSIWRDGKVVRVMPPPIAEVKETQPPYTSQSSSES